MSKWLITMTSSSAPNFSRSLMEERIPGRRGREGTGRGVGKLEERKLEVGREGAGERWVWRFLLFLASEK